MAKEGDQTRWVGVRPTDPSEDIPVTESAPLTQIKVEPLAAGTEFKTLTKKRLPAIGDLQSLIGFTRAADASNPPADGNYNQELYTVPANSILTVQCITATCSGADPTFINMVLLVGVTEYSFYISAYGGAWESHMSLTPIVLDAGEKIRIKWTAAKAVNLMMSNVFGFLTDKYA